MKAKIDKDGNLYIERAGKLKDQCCPFAIPIQSVIVSCGDWCPHFEAEIGKNYVYVHITCGNGRTFSLTNLTDERKP
jgi:hypothetical protein